MTTLSSAHPPPAGTPARRARAPEPPSGCAYMGICVLNICVPKIPESHYYCFLVVLFLCFLFIDLYIIYWVALLV